MRTYSELIKLKTFYERLEYLKLNGMVGKDLWASQRYLNQAFYHSEDWKPIRYRTIVRDSGCDLGILELPIEGQIIVHHIEPITIDDIVNMSSKVTSLDNLICVSRQTHDMIHYGFLPPAEDILGERKPNDTSPWRV